MEWKTGPQLVSFIEKPLEYGDNILVVVDNVLSIDIIESVINIPSYLNEKKACSIRIILPVIILHGIGT